MCKYKKEDVVWLPMRQLSSKDQMIQKLTVTGHLIAFNNEQSQYHILWKAQNPECKTIHVRKTNSLINVPKNEWKTNM